jgi:acyl transferase domain-containing protein/phosphopantetheinyl transferase
MQMNPQRDGVAIVGMACRFPAARNLETFWHNIQHGVDAITSVPPTRWDPLFYDPQTTAVDRFYCQRGGFIDEYAQFDSLKFGIMPVAAEGAEPDQMLALQVAADALLDAGYRDLSLAGVEAGVILGRGNYIGAGMTRLEQHVRTSQQLVECLRVLVPTLTRDQLDNVKHEFQQKLGNYGPDTAIGLVPNLAASRIANRLDLRGPAYTVDAACASSILAVDQAMTELLSGRADVMLAGGVHLSHDVAFWSVFCQLGALSRTEQIRPFDQHADGLLIGEGLGVVVLKRLTDAVAQHDRIYAVIRGTGVSSDGRPATLMMPDAKGQVRAVRQAWKQSGLDPAEVGLIEAHGTATPLGDTVELETLDTVFGRHGDTKVTLGSVKSMIGHTMPAAGIAGLIKAAMAVHHGVLPPSLHCQTPHPILRQSRFVVRDTAESWNGNLTTRIAAVNAFGFGGINTHLVLQSHGEGTGFMPAIKPRPQREGMLRLAADSVTGLLEQLDALARSDGNPTSPDHGPVRVAVSNPTPERIAQARKMVGSGRARSSGRGIWFTTAGLLAAGGKVAFLYPGVEAAFEPRIDDVVDHFQLAAPRCMQPVNLEEQGLGIIELATTLHAALSALGVSADVAAGHSVGEWAGMINCGYIPRDEIKSFVNSLVPGSLEVPGVSFLAVGAGAARVQPLIEDIEQVAISHDNCPHQLILCGADAAMDEVTARLKKARILSQRLPFKSGFHSPMFADFLAPHIRHFEGLSLQSPAVPLWSATTVTRYPTAEQEIRAVAIDHLIKPVRFRELIDELYEHGCRAFVQLGTGSLIGFVQDTLRGKPHVAESANAKERAGLDQLQRVAAALWVEGLDLNWSALQTAPNTLMQLSLGVPLVRLDSPLDVVTTEAELPSDDPVIAACQALLKEATQAGKQILHAFQHADNHVATRKPATAREQAAADAEPPPESVTILPLSVDSHPYLIDHCFFRQPIGWPEMSDRYPVVPLTMTLELMEQAASKLMPGRTIIGLQNVRAYKWIAVEPPTEVTISARCSEADSVFVQIKGYAEGTVLFADRYEPSPECALPELKEAKAINISARELYEDRWMFHGPAYQAITDLTVIGSNGIQGTLTAGPAPGALLDNAGQLFGFWVMLSTEVDRLAMPVKIARISYYHPRPAAGIPSECQVRITRLGRRDVSCDMTLVSEDKVWATIEGWDDWRFETDAKLWPIMQYPERHLYGDILEDGLCVVRSAKRSAGSTDYLSRRFLGAAEREEFAHVEPRQAQHWLSGRIAAKDAARHYCQLNGYGERFPAEITLSSDDQGRPHIDGPWAERLLVSISHQDDLAVAIVVPVTSPAASVGVDIEKIEPRSPGFQTLAFQDQELALLPTDERDAWITRLWCAKEAVGKARGTGLQYNPRTLKAERIEGEKICIDGVWTETRVLGEYALAWTKS